MKKLLLFIGIISWSYNVNAQSCDSNLPVMENFDTNTIGVCWNVHSEDEDSGTAYDWYWREYLPVYGGYKCLVSRSYNTADGALTPDNWVISFPIDLTSFNSSDNIELSWKVRGEYASLSHEKYTAYAATGNQISDFYSSAAVDNGGEYADEVGGTGTFVTRTMDISSLAGNIVYIAFRHHDSTDQYSINIDDISISTSALGIEDFNKENFNYYYNTNSKTLTLKSSSKPISSVKIYNLLGQNTFNKITTNSTENIDLSSLTDGIYIVQIEIDGTTKAIKFLKQ